MYGKFLVIPKANKPAIIMIPVVTLASWVFAAPIVIPSDKNPPRKDDWPVELPVEFVWVDNFWGKKRVRKWS